MFGFARYKFTFRLLFALIITLPAIEATAFDRDWNITSADLDGNKKADMIVNFGQYGVWANINNNSWKLIHSLSSKSIVAGDLDANGQSDLVIDFAPYGIWVLMNYQINQDNQAWFQLDDAASNYMVANDIDRNGKADLVISFPSKGVWLWKNNLEWVKIHPLAAKGIAVGRIDPDLINDVVLNFGENGVWIWMNMSDSSWSQSYQKFTNYKTTLEMTTWTNDPKYVDTLVFSNFGEGIKGCYYSGNNTFGCQPIHGLNPTQMKVADVDGNGFDELIINFGSNNGVWSYTNQLSQVAWIKLSALSAGDMAVADTDGDEHKNIILDFLQYGLWQYNKKTDTWLSLHPASPTLLNTPPNGSGVIPKVDQCAVKLDKPTIPSIPSGQVLSILMSKYTSVSCGIPIYSLTNPPTDMTMDPVTGLIKWTVPYTIGDYIVVVNANIEGGASYTLTFIIRISQSP